VLEERFIKARKDYLALVLCRRFVWLCSYYFCLEFFSLRSNNEISSKLVYEYHPALESELVKWFPESSSHRKIVVIQNGGACEQSFLAEVLQ